MIPKQLKGKGFKFILVGDKKNPIEKKWTTLNNYDDDDSEFLLKIKEAKRYGVLCGFGNLVVIDFDNQEMQDALMGKLPETFTVKSAGRGLNHLYFIIDDVDIGKIPLTGEDGNQLCDIQGSGAQVIGANSILNNKKYEIVNDREITKIDHKVLLSTIYSWLPDSAKEQMLKNIVGKKEKKKTNLPKYCQKIVEKLPLKDLMVEYGFDTSRNPTKCIWHDSKGGQSFSFNGNVWHCFHCEKAGNVIHLMMNQDNILYDEAVRRLGKRLKVKIPKRIANNDDTIKISFIIDEKKIIEQTYDKENGVRFCIYDSENDSWCFAKDYTIGQDVFVPIDDEEIYKGAVKLPSEPIEFDDDDVLDKDISSFINKWLDIPEDFLQFTIWNIKRSWVFDKFHTLNYLRFMGDPGQGKSRGLDTLGDLHYKPITTSGATTSAPIFRIIDKWHGSIIADEADFQKSDEAQDIIKIFNQGYEKGKFVMRCDENARDKIKFFDPFCPKILATRRAFTDKALESRCFTQIMKGTNRQDIPVNLTPSFHNETLKIRNKLLLWRFKHYFKIDTEREIKFDFTGLEPRVRQIVAGLINLFVHDDKQMEKFMLFITKHQEGLIEERRNSFDGSITKGVYECLRRKMEHITAKDIIEVGEIKGYNGKTMDTRALPKFLKSLGFDNSKPMKVNGETKRCIPINEALLMNLFKRYGFEYPIPDDNFVDKEDYEVELNEF